MLICLDMRTGAGCGSQTVNEARFCEHCGQNLRFALMLHDAGTLVGAYRVVRVIGYGGFGAIYEALGAAGEQVALKETFDRSSISTFAREFAVLSRLSHANLPRYMDMFEAQGNGYLVMEYVPGQSLQEILDNQAELLPESQVLGYALQLCDVLAYLHSQQPPILHRDVKPANIRLTPQGRIKLVDFGLLKQGGQQTRATIRGLGTSGYAPIEQYADNQQATNPRSDVYALGATLYHLLSAKEPPSALNRLTDLTHPNNEALSPLPAGLSLHLKEAVLKAMSVMPKERFDDMQAFKQALQGTQTVDQQIMAQATRQKKRKAPALARASRLDGPPIWLTQAFTKTRSGYVIPSSAKSLPYLPLQASGEVLKVAFRSEDSQQRLIGMTKKGIIYQWGVPDGQLLKILSLAVPAESEVTAIAYSPTGETVATVSKDYMIRIWRTEDGQLLHKLRGHRGLINTLAYAPSGDVLASGSYDDELICFWHVATGKLLKKIDEDKRVKSLAFSPDGEHLVGSNYNTSYLWRLADHKPLHTIDQGCNEKSGVQWDSSGKMLIYGSSKTVVLRDAMKGKQIHAFAEQKSNITSLAWHPNGHQVAAGNWGGHLFIFTLDKDEPLHRCEAHNEERVLCLAYTPDGRFLASGGQDQSVRLWALDRAYLPTTTSSYNKAAEVIESPLLNDEEDASVRSSAWWQHSAEIERPSNYVQPTHELDLPHLVYDASGTVRTVGYHADGKELISITEEGFLYRWRINDGQLIKKERLLARKNQLTCAAISPDGQMVATGDKHFMVHIRRLKDGKLLHQLRGHTQEIKALAYTPDSQVLASSGGKDGTVRLWGVADGRLLRKIKPQWEANCLKFSPNGQYLACGSSYRVHIWRMRDKKMIREIEKGCNTEHGISWSQDGQFLLCGDSSKLYIWRVVDGQEMMCFKGHANTIKAVAWHPDGQFVLSVSYDNTVRVWSALAPQLRHVGEGHKHTVHCVAVSPDGRTFASGSEDGTVRLWFLEDNMDELVHHRTEQPSTATKETPVGEPLVVAPPLVSQLKTAAPNSSTQEPSIWRKLGGWLTKQLSD